MAEGTSEDGGLSLVQKVGCTELEINKFAHQRLIVFLVVLVSQLSITKGNRGFE